MEQELKIKEEEVKNKENLLGNKRMRKEKGKEANIKEEIEESKI